MKSILLSIPFGMSARNFLRSDVFRELKKTAKVILVSPLAQNEAFREEFSDPHVTMVSIPPQQSLLRSGLARVLNPLQTYWFTEETQLATLLFFKDLLRRTEPFRYGLYVLMATTVGRFAFVRRALAALYFKVIRNPRVDCLLDENPVDLVFLTHGFVPLEMELAVQASTRKIPVVDMIHSWDNLTSKSGLRQMTNRQVGWLLPVQFYDRVIVWNEILRDELIELYHFPKNRIFISGIPQFDPYLKVPQLSNRGEYLKSLGADPNKRIIFFAATSPSLIHDQTTIVKGLIQALRQGRFGENCQLLIRTHPATDMSSWFEMFKGPGVVFQKPSSAFAAKEVDTWEKNEERPLALAEAIFHCDVFINGMSTTAIEAAVFDKPCICVGFDGDPVQNSSIHLYYKNTHYEKIVRTHGLRIAWNEQELIEFVQTYLANPKLDQEGRERIREEQCYRLDGQSGQRIARYLLELINESPIH